MGHLVEPGYRVYRVVTIPAAHHRRTVRLVAVHSRNDAETAETDFTPSLSPATHDFIDVAGGSRANQHRLSVASRFLVDLPATWGLRSCRLFALSAPYVDCLSTASPSARKTRSAISVCCEGTV